MSKTAGVLGAGVGALAGNTGGLYLPGSAAFHAAPVAGAAIGAGKGRRIGAGAGALLSHGAAVIALDRLGVSGDRSATKSELAGYFGSAPLGAALGAKGEEMIRSRLAARKAKTAGALGAAAGAMLGGSLANDVTSLGWRVGKPGVYGGTTAGAALLAGKGHRLGAGLGAYLGTHAGIRALGASDEGRVPIHGIIAGSAALGAKGEEMIRSRLAARKADQNIKEARIKAAYEKFSEGFYGGDMAKTAGALGAGVGSLAGLGAFIGVPTSPHNEIIGHILPAAGAALGAGKGRRVGAALGAAAGIDLGSRAAQQIHRSGGGFGGVFGSSVGGTAAGAAAGAKAEEMIRSRLAARKADQNIKEARIKAAYEKFSEMLKEVPGLEGGKLIHHMAAREPNIPTDSLNQLADQAPSLRSALAAPTACGMVLKPHEFQRVALRHSGMGGLADHLDSQGQSFSPGMQGGGFSFGLASVPLPVVMQLVGMLLSMIPERSIAPPVMQRRVIMMFRPQQPVAGPAPAQGPTMEKLSQAYFDYRTEVLSAAPFMAASWEHPLIKEAIFAQDLLDVRAGIKTASVSSADLSTAMKIIPLLAPAIYLNSAHLKARQESGEKLGIVSNMIARHPTLVAALAMGAGQLLLNDMAGAHAAARHLA